MDAQRFWRLCDIAKHSLNLGKHDVGLRRWGREHATGCDVVKCKIIFESFQIPDRHRKTKRYCLDATSEHHCISLPCRFLDDFAEFVFLVPHLRHIATSARSERPLKWLPVLFRWFFEFETFPKTKMVNQKNFLTLNISMWTANSMRTARHVARRARLLWMHKATWRRPINQINSVLTVHPIKTFTEDSQVCDLKHWHDDISCPFYCELKILQASLQSTASSEASWVYSFFWFRYYSDQTSHMVRKWPRWTYCRILKIT